MGLFNTKCATCGGGVPAGSKFCPQCGAGSPGGRVACGHCGTLVKADAKFCLNCGTRTAAAPAGDLADNRWVRRPGEFARRVDAAAVDVNTWWKGRELTVEHGTRALVFQAGAFRGEVGPGRYDMGGFLAKLNHFMVDQGMVAILVDAGDVPVDLAADGLRTADGFDVAARARVVMRVQNPEAFFVNRMKGRARVLAQPDPAGGPGDGDDVRSALAGEARMAMAAIVARYPAEALAADPAVRGQIEGALRDALGVTFYRLGLELVQLRFIDFDGERYRQVARRRADLGAAEVEGGIEAQAARDAGRRGHARARDQLTTDRAAADVRADRGQLNRRLRELLTQERMDQFKGEADFEQFVQQAQHEMGMSGVVRGQEMARLKERFQVDRDRESLLRRIEIEGVTNDAKREQLWQELASDERIQDELDRRRLQRELESARSELDRRKISLEMERLAHAERLRQADVEADLEQKKAASGVETLRRVKEMEAEEDRRAVELEQQRLASRGPASAAALLSIVNGPAADKILELERLRAREKMSPEQMLAMAATASPDAAAALASRYAADGKGSAVGADLLAQQLKDARETAAEHAGRMERLMGTAMQEMGQVATSRARPADQQPATAARPIGSCARCGSSLNLHDVFCNRCGQKVGAAG
jgi:hypothetical protein